MDISARVCAAAEVDAIASCEPLGRISQPTCSSPMGWACVDAAKSLIGKSGDLPIGVAIDNRRAGERYERLGYHRTGQFSTMTYDYIDDKGAAHTTTETDEMLTQRW